MSQEWAHGDKVLYVSLRYCIITTDVNQWYGASMTIHKLFKGDIFKHPTENKVFVYIGNEEYATEDHVFDTQKTIGIKEC